MTRAGRAGIHRAGPWAGPLTLLLVCAVTDCAPAHPATGRPAAAASYIGELDSPAPAGADPLIAIDLIPTGQVRRAQVFVCDGRGLWEWLDAPVTGPDLTFTSQLAPAGATDNPSAATINAHLDSQDITGTLHLSDGRAWAFTAHPATGADGLYQVDTINPDGTSARGGRLEGTVTPGGQTSQTFTGPDGSTETLDGLLSSFVPAETATCRGLCTATFGTRSEGVSRRPAGHGFVGNNIDL